ncbi:MAG: hypothetical protein WB622_21350 [Acidobacteriaceae bacterium]
MILSIHVHNDQDCRSAGLNLSGPESIPPLFPGVVYPVEYNQAVLIFKDQRREFKGNSLMLALIGPVF